MGFSKGGILLWCFRGAGLLQKDWDTGFTPAVNTFIKTVLLQEKSGRNRTAQFEHGSLALKYRLDNEFELVFVAAYQKMLPLLYLDKLLDEIQLRFRDRFEGDLKDKSTYYATGEDGNAYAAFGKDFHKTMAAVEARFEAGSTGGEIDGKKMRTFEESIKSQKTVASMIENPVNNNKNKKGNKQSTAQTPSPQEYEVEDQNEDELGFDEIQANIKRMAGGGKKAGGKKASAAGPVKSPKAGKNPKKATTWDKTVFGGNVNSEDVKALDRSAPAGTNVSRGHNGEMDSDHQRNFYVPDETVVGNSANLREYDDQSSDEEEEIERTTKQQTAKSGIWSSLSSLVGSKQLSSADVEPVIAKMQEHLIAKNVAAEVAADLCKSVSNKLEGKVMGTFSTVHRTVKDALTESLMQLLTPKRRVDIIRDVYEAKQNKRPYVMTFCGVNGVGKSTNLAKICFWLVENKCRVLVAACDTFRAGAVEQLRTHTKRLNSLYPAQNQPDGKPVVELYEKGYGKDAAGIALEAINYARSTRIDVVLVDTAGRMQDNQPLMIALAKLISVNDPDLVLFVGEALVGNEAVDQLVRFNQALADHSPSRDNPHLIDGMVLSKFDTIDDKVGSAISMTYITGQPILFVGTGQTYTDLKSLNSKAVVQALMK